MWILLVLTVLSIAGLMCPWTLESHASTKQGIYAELKFLRKVRVLVIRKYLMQSSRIDFFGFKYTLPTGKPGTSYGSLTNWGRFVWEKASIDTFLVLVGYFRGMIKITKPRLEISGEIGLGDPAVTGLVYGLVNGFLLPSKVNKINLTPNFFDVVADGEVKLTMDLIPMALLGHTLRAALHRDLRNVWFSLLVSPRTVNTEEVHNIGS